MSTYSLILETDPPTIASRVSMRGAESDIPLTDRVSEVGFVSTCAPEHCASAAQRVWHSNSTNAMLLQVNIQSFLATAKEQLARSLLK